MKIHLIRKESVWDFVASHAQAKSSFINFMDTLSEAKWALPNDIKRTFSSADLVCNNERVVFNIGGNNWRMICGLKFRTNVVLLFVKFIDTHAEYTKLCKAKKNQVGICEVDNFKST